MRLSAGAGTTVRRLPTKEENKNGQPLVEPRAWTSASIIQAGDSRNGTTDAQLLDWFVSRRDEAAEAAFEELVFRHGPMVFRVCRSVLRDTHDAEDAFQAVFVVLAHRAPSIRRRGSLASWLFGVAQRVAWRAKMRG